MAITGAIFDMDGTLTDSMHLWVNAWRDFPKVKGIQATEEELQTMQGMMLNDMARYLNEHFGLPGTPKEIRAQIDQLTEQGYFHEVELKPGVVETLERLKQNNVKMVLATATDRYLAEGCLKRLGILDYFQKVYTAAEYGSKYDSQIFLTAWQELGTPKEETYVFEDTLDAIRGAKKAGFKVIAVHDKWSAHNHDKIVALADQFYDSLKDLDLSTLGIPMTRKEKAMNLFLEGYNCNQAVILAFQDLLPLSKEMLAKLGSGFGGGIGRLREVCGAVSGMVTVLDLLYGYTDPKDTTTKAAQYKDIQELAAKFEQQNGSIICRDLLHLRVTKDNPTPDERTAQYYHDRRCKDMVGTGAELLEEYIAAHPLPEKQR